MSLEMNNTTGYIRSIALKQEKIASFDTYPFSLPVVSTLDTLEMHPKVTYFVGENGSGKSTLLEALAVYMGFNAEGGSKNFNFDTHASHSVLHDYLRVARNAQRPKTGFFLRAESYYNVATEIERLDLLDSYGGVSLHEQSHGESFWALLEHRFGANGLYILDEPEAALSPQRQMAVLSRIHELVNQSCQFIIATHSPILLAYPDAAIYQIEPDAIRPVSYQECETYTVAKSFLNNPEKMLTILLDNPEELF